MLVKTWGHIEVNRLTSGIRSNSWRRLRPARRRSWPKPGGFKKWSLSAALPHRTPRVVLTPAFKHVPMSSPATRIEHVFVYARAMADLPIGACREPAALGRHAAARGAGVDPGRRARASRTARRGTAPVESRGGRHSLTPLANSQPRAAFWRGVLCPSQFCARYTSRTAIEGASRRALSVALERSASGVYVA